MFLEISQTSQGNTCAKINFHEFVVAKNLAGINFPAKITSFNIEWSNETGVE